MRTRTLNTLLLWTGIATILSISASFTVVKVLALETPKWLTNILSFGPWLLATCFVGLLIIGLLRMWRGKIMQLLPSEMKASLHSGAYPDLSLACSVTLGCSLQFLIIIALQVVFLLNKASTVVITTLVIAQLAVGICALWGTFLWRRYYVPLRRAHKRYKEQVEIFEED